MELPLIGRGPETGISAEAKATSGSFSCWKSRKARRVVCIQVISDGAVVFNVIGLPSCGCSQRFCYFGDVGKIIFIDRVIDSTYIFTLTAYVVF